MSGHDKGCPCVRCNPPRCTDCGIEDYTHRPDGLGLDGRCTHRRACEARQMINEGAGIDLATAHAQGRPS